MNDITKQLLEKAGYDKEVIEAISSEKLPEDFDPIQVATELEESNKNRYLELFKNDESFKDEVIKSNDAKWANTLNGAFKKIGVPIEDIKDVPINDKIKLTTEFIENQAKEKYKDSGKKVSEEIESLQSQLVEKTNALKEIEETAEQKVKEATEQASQTISQFKVNSELKGMFSDIPSERLITKQHTDGVWKAVKSTLLSQYDAVLDDDGKLGFNIKGKQEKPTGVIDNKTVILEPKDVLRNTVEDLGFWVKSNGQGPKNDEIIDKKEEPDYKFANQGEAISAALEKFKPAAQA